MTRKEDEGGVELTGNDLKKAMSRLGRGPMRFAFGCKDGAPVLLMHPTKSAKALSQKLRAELGATKTTHGTASADGKALVLDVEGPPVSGMGRMVKSLLRKECIGKYTQARVRCEGEDVVDAEDACGEDVSEEYSKGGSSHGGNSHGGEYTRGEEAGGEDATLGALRELRARIQASEKQLAAILPRLGQGHEGDRAFVLDYCRSSAELYRRAQGCSDPELVTYGKACSGRARKVAEYVRGSTAQTSHGAACAPAASLGGSVGEGGDNAGGDVALVQGWLARKGYRVVADGLCGPITIAAIVAFQRDHVGAADGLVEPGQNTWSALTGKPPLQPNHGGTGGTPGYGEPETPTHGNGGGPGYGGGGGPGYGNGGTPGYDGPNGGAPGYGGSKRGPPSYGPSGGAPGYGNGGTPGYGNGGAPGYGGGRAPGYGNGGAPGYGNRGAPGYGSGRAPNYGNGGAPGYGSGGAPGYGEASGGYQQPGPSYGNEPWSAPHVEEERGASAHGQDSPHQGYVEPGSASSGGLGGALDAAARWVSGDEA